MTFITVLKVLWFINLATGFAPMLLIAISILYLLEVKLNLIETGIDWNCK